MAQVTLKGNTVNTAGELPKEGDQLPDFRLVPEVTEEPDYDAALKALD